MKNRCDQDEQLVKKEEQIDFKRLWSVATGQEMCMLRIGWIFACLSGAILPVFIWMLGDIFDAYNPTSDAEETRDEIRKVFYKMLVLAACICITATFYYYMLVGASHMITLRIKKLYLEAVLRQESAWFDTINFTELPARI